MADNRRLTLPLDLAMELLEHKGNSNTVEPGLFLDEPNLTAADIEFIGSAVRHNSQIEDLSIYWDTALENVPEESWNDLLYFIANNPSLEILVFTCRTTPSETELQAFTNVQNWIVKAAAQNKNIGYLDLEPAALLDGTGIPSRAEMLCLANVVPSTAQSWSVDHSLEKLFIEGDKQGLESANSILEKEAAAQNKSPIKCMQLYGHSDIQMWLPALPNFLLSKASSLLSLRLHNLDLYSNENMDELIRGLQSSPTTSMLSLEGCIFNARSTQQFLGFLSGLSNRCPVTHLHIRNLWSFKGAALAELFTCQRLQSLELLDITSKIRANLKQFRIGLGRSRLTKLTLSSNIARELIPLIQQNLSFLSSLRCFGTVDIDRSQDSLVPNIRAIASLVQDPRCQIHTLELNLLDDGIQRTLDADAYQAIHSALAEMTAHLECLQVNPQLLWRSSGIFHGFLAEDQNLRCLEINCSIDFLDEDKLEEDLSRNWSLESFMKHWLEDNTFMQSKAHLFRPASKLPKALRAKIEGFMERNKMKKRIDALSENATHDTCFEMLEALWELPDWGSLALSLLEKAPQLFAAVAAAPIRRSVKRQRRV